MTKTENVILKKENVYCLFIKSHLLRHRSLHVAKSYINKEK